MGEIGCAPEKGARWLKKLQKLEAATRTAIEMEVERLRGDGDDVQMRGAVASGTTSSTTRAASPAPRTTSATTRATWPVQI